MVATHLTILIPYLSLLLELRCPYPIAGFPHRSTGGWELLTYRYNCMQNIVRIHTHLYDYYRLSHKIIPTLFKPIQIPRLYCTFFLFTGLLCLVLHIFLRFLAIPHTLVSLGYPKFPFISYTLNCGIFLYPSQGGHPS